MSLAMKKHLQASAKKATKNGGSVNQNVIKYKAQGVAPAPSRDFFELLVYEESVLWRTWRVKNSREVRFLPTEQKIACEDFPDNRAICSLVRINLGEQALELALGFCYKDWLQRLPKWLFVRIANHLEAIDLCNLCQVSKALNLQLKNETIWKRKYQVDFKVVDTDNVEVNSWKDVSTEANKLGWKKTYKLEFRRRCISGN